MLRRRRQGRPDRPEYKAKLLNERQRRLVDLAVRLVRRRRAHHQRSPSVAAVAAPPGLRRLHQGPVVTLARQTVRQVAAGREAVREVADQSFAN